MLCAHQQCLFGDDGKFLVGQKDINIGTLQEPREVLCNQQGALAQSIPATSGSATFQTLPRSARVFHIGKYCIWEYVVHDTPAQMGEAEEATKSLLPLSLHCGSILINSLQNRQKRAKCADTIHINAIVTLKTKFPDFSEVATSQTKIVSEIVPVIFIAGFKPSS